MGFPSVLGVIPARYQSSRFPGKPLVRIAGHPMIEWVYRRVQRVLSNVVVATDDRRIFKAVKKFGGRVLMTPRSCKSGTDRMFAVSKKLRARYYANIQGDEPLMDLATIRNTVRLAIKKKAIGTAAVPLKKKDFKDPHVVKVVVDSKGRALYFSRSPIPYSRDGKKLKMLKHLGIYVYPSVDLSFFVKQPQPPLEKAEKLEQLRALYHGQSIYVAQSKKDSIGVDTPRDLSRLKKIFRKRR